MGAYTLSPAQYAAMFAVPASLTDTHIKLCGALQIKVLLLILRHADTATDADFLCAALGQPRSEILDALQYWISSGVIAERDGEVPCAGTPAEKTKPNAVDSPRHPDAPAQYSNEEILCRAEESAELTWLFTEAQRILGKSLGFTGQSLLLLLHDSCGLPAEVVAMLLQYCVQVGKTNFQYIEKVGRDWGTREIDSIDKAEAQIESLSQTMCLWRTLAQSVGLQTPRPTAQQAEYIKKWMGLGFGAELIVAAYEEMANHTGRMKFSYMDKVLETYKQNGWTTLAAVEAGRIQPAATQKKNGASAPKRSYDMQAFIESTWTVPEYKKTSGA
jgi:DnaD/phage-associated family protein